MASTSPLRMRALVAPKYCSPDGYEIADLPRPEITDAHGVLVRVHAASVNPHDVKEAKGLMKLAQNIPFPKILAYDFSGVVATVGTAVTRLKVGDAVFGMLPLDNLDKGAVAEYIAIAEDELAIKPSNLTHVEAASLPLVLYTARNSLNQADGLLEGGLKGKTVFIPGGLSGTGSVAIQLAKHVYDAARVITTVSTSKRPLVAQYLGEGTVDQIIDYKTQEVGKEVPPGSVDFVYDTLGMMTALIPIVRRPGGVILSIASMPRSDAAKKAMLGMPFWLGWVLDVFNWYYGWLLSGKQITYEFVFGAYRNGDLDRVGEWIEGKKLKPVVGKVVDFSDLKAMRDGCGEIERGTGTVGKFVIRLVNDEMK